MFESLKLERFEWSLNAFIGMEIRISTLMKTFHLHTGLSNIHLSKFSIFQEHVSPMRSISSWVKKIHLELTKKGENQSYDR